MIKKYPAHGRHIKGEGVEPETVVHSRKRHHHPIHFTMKSALIALVSLSALAVASHGVVHQHRSGGWVQNPSGQASFTEYSGCGTPCKLRAYFRGLVLHRAHADRDALLQRAA
jgi:hypothetical protein